MLRAVVGIGIFVLAASDREIGTVQEFWQWVQDTRQQSQEGETVKLTADLDFTGALPLGKFGTLVGQTASTSGNPTNVAFKGTFDGQDHVISHLELYNDGSSYPDAALFGALENAVVKNLRFDESCRFFGQNAAAVAITSKMSTIQNVHNRAMISARLIGAGLVVEMQGGTMTGSSNNATIMTGTAAETDDTWSAGLVAKVTTSPTTIQNCANAGMVVTRYGDVGGIVAASTAELVITECSNKGLLVSFVYSQTGEVAAGGCIGRAQGTTTIDKFINGGEVHISASYAQATDLLAAGGVAGTIIGAKLWIKNSINAAVVQADGKNFRIGGIVGTVGDGGTLDLNNVANHGTVSSETDGNEMVPPGDSKVVAISDKADLAEYIVNTGSTSETEKPTFFMFAENPTSTNDNLYALAGTVNISGTPNVLEMTKDGNQYLYDGQKVFELLNGGLSGSEREQWNSDLYLDGVEYQYVWNPEENTDTRRGFEQRDEL